MSEGCRASLIRRQQAGWHDYKYVLEANTAINYSYYLIPLINLNFWFTELLELHLLAKAKLRSSGKVIISYRYDIWYL